jgi:hypothetical protein
MRSRQIKSLNPYTAAVNNKLVETKEYNELQADVADILAATEVTGARDETEGALAKLITVLANLGIIKDSTTAS